MKRLVIILLCAFSMHFAHGTVLTVCNMPYSPGQYTTMFDAINAASFNDTIYVHGSSINYGSVYINKPLVIIGTGHNPNKMNPLVSSFLDITVDANNVQIHGLKMTRLSSVNRNSGVIKKCRILQATTLEAMSLLSCTDWIIEGNIIESGGTGIFFWGAPANNTVIRYNVFITGYSAVVGIYNSSSQLGYVLNNVFLGNFNFNAALLDLRYCSIENNIFHGISPTNNSLQNCTANNNISYQASDPSFYTPGANNLVNVNPEFTNYPGSPTLYSYAWDLSLAATSPGHNSGTDGTDRGLFGGIGNLFSVTGEPAIAEVTAFTITSPAIIAPGGTLTISVTSKRVH